MPQGYVKTIVKLDISSNVKNVGEQSYSFSLKPNNVSRACVLQEDGTWLLTEKTHRNYGSNLYMYGNKLRPRNVVGKDLSYDGVRFGETDENGLLDLTLTVTAAGADGLVQGVIVYGDFYALQYATEAELDDGTIIKSDDEVWAIRWNEPAKTHTVTFKKWNRANYNACFTHLTVLPSVLEFDRRKLRHVDSLSQCTGQRDTIWYGVIWNTGSIEIWDSDGEIYDYIKDGIIEDTQMPIIIENKGRHGATALQHHLNARASYEIETRMLKIELTNKLEAWDTMKYAGRALTEACTAWELLVEVFGTIGYTEDDVKAMCDKKIPVLIPSTKTNIEMTVEEFFRAVTIPYPYLEESTFREAITKFCQLGMLWCYCDDDDNIKFVSARPKLLQGELDRAYTWPNSRKYGTTTRDLFLRNRFKKVEAQINNVSQTTSTIATLSFEGYSYDQNGNLDTTFSNRNEYDIEIIDYDATESLGIPAQFTFAVFLRYVEISTLYKLTGETGLGGSYTRTAISVKQGESKQLTHSDVMEVGNDFSGSICIYDTYDEFKQNFYRLTENSAAIIKNLSTKNQIAVAGAVRVYGKVAAGTGDEETEYAISVSMRVALNTVQTKSEKQIYP